MKTLFNGNVEFGRFSAESKRFVCSYAERSRQEGIIVPCEWEGKAAAQFIRDGVIKVGYNTTANGRCDDLVGQAGEVIYQAFNGNAHSFARYVVVSIDEFNAVNRPKTGVLAVRDAGDGLLSFVKR